MDVVGVDPPSLAGERSTLEAYLEYQQTCDESRAIAAGHGLDDTGIGPSRGEPVSLRWIYLFMLAQSARHSRQADPVRGRMDGIIGD